MGFLDGQELIAGKISTSLPVERRSITDVEPKRLEIEARLPPFPLFVSLFVSGSSFVILFVFCVHYAT